MDIVEASHESWVVSSVGDSCGYTSNERFEELAWENHLGLCKVRTGWRRMADG